MSEIRDLTIHIENVVSAEALTAFHLEIARLPYRPNTVGFLYAREGLKLPAPGRRAHALGRRAVTA
ncbi:hypothetical protein [Prescottella equi]|uniref:hypothetical protein n=1 Tax=Rhodococcus hoagii TaxID=43767 RepID=UPI0019D8D9B8|nr:hypothetical protein [Prescottella equi]MBM4644237.1 hypothetical protein [Prescottella equi]MBM4645570.1 hypothetical protein [Prescottella equi]MBM4657407.1 hypothetical protein [Prescottella equi]MBM4720215.1 hypothetical protein [Prescottella equi]MBM4720281.1 hypothetical protein [Prescottella equi]